MKNYVLSHVDWRLFGAALYLCIPNLVFGIYFSITAAIVSIMAATCLIWILTHGEQRIAQVSKSNSLTQFFLLVIAVTWTYASGVTGHIYSNPDWHIRLTLLNDLIILDWPVTYQHNGENFLLRAPLGYYLPSTLVGKIFDSYVAGLWALFAWGTIGLYLTLSIAFEKFNPRMALLGAGIIILFSGMDVFGYLLRYNGIMHLGDHLEWWAGKWQYSSNTTLLFWTPNHAISAWLFTALIIRRNQNQVVWNSSPLLLAMTLTYSPLSFIGSTALYCLVFYKRIFTSLHHNKTYQASTITALVLFGVGSQYILINSLSIPAPLHGSHPFFVVFGVRLLFFALEFGILSFLIWPLTTKKEWLISSSAILIALPLLPPFGPGNDLVMRASIAPLFCICLLSLDLFLAPETTKHKLRKLLIISILALGSITAAQELIRPLTQMKKLFIPKKNLYEETLGQAKHYYTPLITKNQPSQ